MRKKCAGGVVFGMPLPDTRTNAVRLCGICIADFGVQIFSYAAERERFLISEHQRWGISCEDCGVCFCSVRREFDGFLPGERARLYAFGKDCC